ncbi:MAG TPA: aspartyl protease family protein [Candidatus Acidoferrum sp.]|jgi:hypothetical protein
MKASKTRVLLVMALLLLAGTNAGAKTRGELASNELPMEVYDGYLIVVEGSIGELCGLKFLLDTGATTSAIDLKLADTLRLSKRPGKLINVDKTVRIEWSELPQLDYGPQHASNVKVIVQDLRYLGASGVHVDGVIGWDLLRRQSFRLDFARKRIVFGTTEDSGGKSVPMRADGLYVAVQVELDGRPLWMIADTGMRGTTFYEGWLQEMREGYHMQARTMGWSAGGAVESRIAFVPRLRLGTQDLDRGVHLVHPSGAESLRGIAGYLGISSLGAKEVTFDFERNELRWKK